MPPPAKIVSGGQTGADRAALDWAIFHDIPHGGWCPKGRKAEDGILSAQYQLTETPSASYPQRTQWNVRDSDGTVIFTISAKLSGGSKLTADAAIKFGKPWIHSRRQKVFWNEKSIGAGALLGVSIKICILAVRGQIRSGPMPSKIFF